jgi:hypothetical protein
MIKNVLSAQVGGNVVVKRNLDAAFDSHHRSAQTTRFASANAGAPIPGAYPL